MRAKANSHTAAIVLSTWYDTVSRKTGQIESTSNNFQNHYYFESELDEVFTRFRELTQDYSSVQVNRALRADTPVKDYVGDEDYYYVQLWVDNASLREQVQRQIDAWSV